MDQRVTISPGSVTPMMVKLKLNFTTDTEFYRTMRDVELAYWNYLDYYTATNPKRYPMVNFSRFLYLVMRHHGLDTRNNAQYCRTYEKYKKNLPTAGIILHHNKEFVIIRMNMSKIWSMPKGKQDNSTETLMQTAIREFMEETGIDLSDVVNDTTPHRKVLKTEFYIVEADHKQNNFVGYNVNEISEVRWISADDVLRSPHLYSKQTTIVAEIMQQK